MTRLYKLLLRVYPRWFRERYVDELVEAFASDRRRLRPGIASTLRLWIGIVADLLVSASRPEGTCGLHIRAHQALARVQMVK